MCTTIPGPKLSFTWNLLYTRLALNSGLLASVSWIKGVFVFPPDHTDLEGLWMWPLARAAMLWVNIPPQGDVVSSEEGPKSLAMRARGLRTACDEFWDSDLCHMALVLWKCSWRWSGWNLITSGQHNVFITCQSSLHVKCPSAKVLLLKVQLF